MAEKVDLKEGVKPVTGAPSSFGRGTTIRQLDDEGRIKTVRTSGAPLDTTNVKTPQEAANPERIGDYYYDSAKNLQVWENSPTDLLQKYRLAVGGTEKPADLLSPSGEALSILGPAVGAGVAAGAAAGGPVGVAVGAVAGLIGGLTNFNNAREEALKRWQEENVKYDSAVEFYKDDDGSVKYKVDYQKMGTGGPRSGERIKEAQNRETQVSLGDDGRLKVRVSPIFASTARFQEMMDFISTNYGNLSKDTENLDQVLTEIKDGIDGEVKSYISNMRLYADFAQKFQNASPETIVSSYITEMAGYVDPTKMKDFQMTVLGDDDKVATRSAAEFFDSVFSMDKAGRNNLATKLNDIVYGESNNYTDDQRAIAYGELQAMYTASANPEKFENNKYQGMMDADGFVSFMNSFSPLGLNGGDVLKFLSGGAYSKQEMLNPDEWAQFFGGAAGIGAGFGLWKGGTSLLEAGLKRLPGTAQLYAASATGQGMDNVRALFAAGETGKGIAAWAAEAGFKTIKIGAFDAALAGAQTAVSNEDFWSNFGQDFARDATLEAIFSYYDMAQMQNAVNESTVRLYVDKKTGQLRRLNEYKGEEFTTYEIDDDGLLTETTYKEGLKANVWRTEKGGTGAVLQTPGGTTVTIVDGEVKYTPGAKVVEGEAVDVTEAFNEIPVMSTGVVNTSEGPIEVATLLERAGLPKDTQVFEMSESSANAAMVAGKIAAVQNTKVGMEIYKQLFNKNGVLDVANNMALAKDGDLNSWRNAQEYFVSVQNNAMRNLNDIQNGVYFKEAAAEWAKTVELMGKFNYEYKYEPKTDGAYINAILNIERAELLNQSRVEGDTTDYVAKALEVYGDVLAEMPADRGELLQNWVQQGKKWLKTFNESVKKSGKVDMEKLENITDTDIDSEIGWFPVWGKKQKYKGLLDSFRGITKERNPYRSWLRDGEWVPANQLGDPWDNMNRYMGFVANNMGLNDMTEQAATVYDRAGLLVDNTPTDATIRKRKLESIKNKDELNKKLDEMVAEAKKEAEERTLTPAEYSDAMAKIYEDSAIPETVDALSMDLSETKRYALQTNYDDGGKSLATREKRQKIVDLEEDIKITEQRIERYNNGVSWRVTKIPEDLDADAKKNLKKLQQQHIKDGKKAATELGYTGGSEEFDAWSKNKIEQMKANRDNLVTEVLNARGQERPAITFEGELYSSSEVPTDYISKRSERQKISDDILGVWNSYNGGLANAWLNEGDASVKKELRETIERNPKLRAALLSTMYDNSGSKLPYEEWLNTPITITRQQEADSLRPEDAFLSFSMQKNWQGMGGLTPRLDNVPGDIITLKVKPKDTLGEIPKGIEAEDEQEVIVPREVYATAMTSFEDYERGAQVDPEMAGRIRDSYRGAMANRLIKEATRVVGLAEDYLSEYGYGADWQSYLNTSLIPDLQNAINQNMLPDEFSSFVQARMAQAIQDVAPYQSPELILKSRLEGVAQEWRDWALKHIKAGRATQKDLKEFVNSHNLELPNDKRPYPEKIKHALWEMVQNNKRLPEIEGINPIAISKEMDKNLFYQMLDDTPLFQSAVKDKNELLDLMALERNKETTDSFTMGTAATAAGLGGRYPMTWFKNGKPYTRFIKYDTKGHLLIAEQTTKALNDKELLKEDGLISKAAAFVANDFRLLTTGWDPSRSLPNLARDTGRSFTLGRRFINAKEMLKSSIDAGSYTKKQREMLEKAIENAANAASNSSYNSAYRTTRGTMKNITKDYLSQSGANPMKRFFYNVVHDKRSILEWPMEFFEGYSRRANARSLAAVQLRKDQKAGANFKTQLKNAATAAEWAGREYTANFQRKGELIGRVSKYVAYQSSAYAGFDSMMRAFINDPKLVARNFAAFVLAYLVLLADTLSREETRKQYYRLSDYDRENQIVIGIGDSILTIPMDQELAGLLFPYRRIMETLNGTDPVSFFEFVWGSLTAALPPDLSGFSEGDGFNLSRGLEKLTSQNMPNLLTGIVETSTGYDLYYGTQTSVSKETLKDYGIYAPEPGDYTTTGKDSATLRGVANATGIPQWQLQVMLDNYGGNVGKYVLNTLDKLSGATKDQQGGKDFVNTVFNSFTGLDQDAASNAFYAGITQLKDEKDKLIQKIADYNEDLKTASGDAKVELQNKISQAKRDYGTKVGDFVDKYVSAYEITGGLPKSQAQQVYFLFRLDDNDTLYQSGSVEEYYNNQAVQQFKNQATAMSAPVLDKYYNNRLGNIYQDSEGVWRRYLSSGAQAMRNSVYGLGEQQKVDLLNILEGKNSNLKTLRAQIKNARSQAYEAQDWDTRDALAYELDKQILQTISPYIEQYGAENVLGNTDVLEYLSEWFIVPDDFIRSKKGKYVSLGHNASTQKAFVQPFIKYIFGLPTNFSSYNDAKITPTELGGQ